MRQRLTDIYHSQYRFFWLVLGGALLVRLGAIFFVFGRVGLQTDDALYYLELARDPIPTLLFRRCLCDHCWAAVPAVDGPHCCTRKYLGPQFICGAAAGASLAILHRCGNGRA